jgi:protocatechuate 3,4-dioxygenase beta subunit
MSQGVLEMVDDRVRASRERVSRRRAMRLGGAVGLSAVLAACSNGSGTSSGPTARATASSSASSPAPTSAATRSRALELLNRARTCTTAREETPGPYWFDVDSIRRDVREDRPGTRLDLALRVHDVSACAGGGDVRPVEGCVVEIWHCDAGGVYSGFESASAGAFGGGDVPAPPDGPGADEATVSDGAYSEGEPEARPADDGTYLRGAQASDEDGIVRFTTIYPGWYPGRTVHIHLKVHIDRQTVLTTQLYFDEADNTEAHRTAPYDEHTGRDTTNATDSIFEESALLTVEPADDGYLGVTNLGIDA